MRQQTPDRVTSPDGLHALTQDDDGQADGRRAITARARGIRLPRRRLVRRSLWGGGALVALGAIGVGVVVGSAGNTASDATIASAKLGSAAVGRSTLSLGSPTIITKAIASGEPVPSAANAAHKKATKQPKATKRTASAQPSASSSATGSTPAATPTGSLTGSSGGLDPSGQNPATTLSGFTFQYVQEFNGNSMPPNWDAYNGVPGGESASVAEWVPSMCTFSGGEAHFMASGIDSCGLQFFGDSQEYGAWFARLKGDDEPSDMWFSDIFLLWPANNQWPPEIDIYEDGGRSRGNTNASLFDTVGDICGSAPTQQCLQPYTQSNAQSGGVANDGTEWHTYGVEWTPSGVSWLIDGQVVYTAPASQVKSPAQQPALPMNMDLQSQNLTGAGTPTTRETMTVDWVEQFSWNG
jgi:hypothetical protein